MLDTSDEESKPRAEASLLSARASRLESHDGVRRILNILLAISSVTLSQCVSGPKSGISLGADSRVAVVYEQTKQNLRQSIHCDRQIDPAVYYSSATADKLAQIATVERMQILLH